MESEVGLPLRVGMNVEHSVFSVEPIQWFWRNAVICLCCVQLFISSKFVPLFVIFFLLLVLFPSESERDPLKEGQGTKVQKHIAQG